MLLRPWPARHTSYGIEEDPMSNDDLSRKMEFIVEWQAQFATDIQMLKERQDRFQGQLETLTAVANTALETSTKTAEVVTTVVEALGAAQAETERQISRVARLLGAHVREGHPPDVATS
jgi:hypothetical protein